MYDTFVQAPTSICHYGILLLRRLLGGVAPAKVVDRCCQFSYQWELYRQSSRKKSRATRLVGTNRETPKCEGPLHTHEI